MSPAPPPNQPIFNQQQLLAKGQAAMTGGFTIAGHL